MRGFTSGMANPLTVIIDSNETVLANFALPLVPKIASFSPASGPVGTAVVILGENFDPVPTNNIVYFGALKGIVTAASAAALTVMAPAGASDAPLTLTTHGLTAYGNVPFALTFPSLQLIDSHAFGDAVNVGAPLNGELQAVADLDGDGKLDIIALNTGSPTHTISILRNTTISGSSAISFAPSVEFDIGEYPSDVAIGDLDGDGRLDLVVVNALTGICVLRNTSVAGSITPESFAPRVEIDVGEPLFFRFYSAAIRDLDEDGKPDLMLCSTAEGYVAILRNVSTPGNVSLTLAARLWPPGGIGSVAAGDLDGDGKPDLVIAGDPF